MTPRQELREWMKSRALHTDLEGRRGGLSDEAVDLLATIVAIYCSDRRPMSVEWAGPIPEPEEGP